jgi:hypothetical protein
MAEVKQDSLARIAASSMGTLEEHRCYGYTNARGYALFKLKLTAGLPGLYSLVFESGETRGSASQRIQVTNPIAAVVISKSQAQTYVLSTRRYF